MAEPVHTIDTQHGDTVHDAQFDYYGKRLATCSSDRSIKVYDVSGSEYKYLAELKGHEGAIWEVCWAHPKFGSLLASCSYDRSVLIHKEVAANTWSVVHKHTAHASSVNSIAWCPQELGLSLACASSDGSISVITHKDNDTWESCSVKDSAVGVNAVSWAPYHHVGCQAGSQVTARLASAGADHMVRVYRRIGDSGEWALDDNGLLKGHNDWVRDVAWAPSSGLPVNMMATAGEDKKVFIWRQAAAGGEWTKQALPTFGAPVWRVSWSVTGNLLAVSCGDNSATLWKESLTGAWEQVSDITPDAANPASAASGGVSQG